MTNDRILTTTLSSAEKESLTSKIDNLTRTNDELSEKLEMSKKEKESQVERFLTSMSELQTMAEVAEVDRRELEMKVGAWSGGRFVVQQLH